MKALVVKNKSARVEEIESPAAAGEALVAMRLSGVCNTDLEIARGYAGFEGTIGHELFGTVLEGAGDIPVGARVVGEINAGCGTCALCIGGDARHCPTRTVLGIVGRDGAHAEIVRLPARNLLVVADSIPDEEAVFAEPLAAACGVLERCPIEAGARVAVIGDGKLGLLCAQVLAHAGHAPLVIGKHREKLDLVARRGLETELSSQARKRGRVFDVVVEATGSETGFSLALDLLVPRGALVLKSTFHGSTPIDAARLVVEETRVIGSRCGRLADALALLEKKAVDVRSLISERLPLSKGAAAMELAARPGIMKVILES